METDLKVIDLEECNLCPHKNLGIYTDSNRFYTNKQIYGLNKLIYIKCKSYDSCKWLKNKLVESD